MASDADEALRGELALAVLRFQSQLSEQEQRLQGAIDALTKRIGVLENGEVLLGPIEAEAVACPVHQGAVVDTEEAMVKVRTSVYTRS